MKKDPTIREAIDESLCAVRFNAQDERNVMAVIHGRRVKAKKRARRLNLAFAAGLLLLLVLPVSASRCTRSRLSAVNAAAPGEDRIFSPGCHAGSNRRAFSAGHRKRRGVRRAHRAGRHSGRADML